MKFNALMLKKNIEDLWYPISGLDVFSMNAPEIMGNIAKAVFYSISKTPKAVPVYFWCTMNGIAGATQLA